MSYENPQQLVDELTREVHGDSPVTALNHERFGPLPEHEVFGVDGYNEQIGMEIK